MSELLRGLISVGILVLAISVIYLVIQNYKESKLTADSSGSSSTIIPTQAEKEGQQQQDDPEAKLQAEKDKVDEFATAMEENLDKSNTTSAVKSPL
ncbi:MAG TPA: hypothetical protein VH415_06315 [Nitrososphaeraceae archaeon]|jgi:hypothetical protein